MMVAITKSAAVAVAEEQVEDYKICANSLHRVENIIRIGIFEQMIAKKIGNITAIIGRIVDLWPSTLVGTRRPVRHQLI